MERNTKLWCMLITTPELMSRRDIWATCAWDIQYRSLTGLSTGQSTQL